MEYNYYMNHESPNLDNLFPEDQCAGPEETDLLLDKNSFNKIARSDQIEQARDEEKAIAKLRTS